MVLPTYSGKNGAIEWPIYGNAQATGDLQVAVRPVSYEWNPSRFGATQSWLVPMSNVLHISGVR